MTPTRSIRSRLLRDQVLLILLLGAALLATTFLGARRAVERLSGTVVARALEGADSELRRFVDPVETALRAVGALGEAGVLAEGDADAFGALIGPVVENRRQISGILRADELGNEEALIRIDGAWRSRVTRFDGTGGSSEWLGGPAPEGIGAGEYDPRSRPWFAGATAEPGSIHWTEPYLFHTLRSQGMTASLAYRAPSGRLHVAAVDVDLGDLARYVRGIEVSPNGSLWVVTEDRRLVAWPDDPTLWEDRDPATALLRQPRELGLELVDAAVVKLATRPLERIGEPVGFASGGRDWWVAGRRFDLSAERTLVVGALVPHADLLGDRAQLRLWIVLLTLLAIAAAVARAVMLARRFSRPIEALARESDRISQGDLEPCERVASGLAEVESLADAHERMRRGLKTLLKLERDLQIARQIQRKTFPRELPRLAGFDLCAWSQPADETGGDSYDVVGLGEDGSIRDGEVASVLLMLADATGHGIGPALSVTQLRAMLRMAVRSRSDLREMAAHINEQLYADLPGNRFVTTWLGVLGGDGTLATLSAAQAPLLHYHAASGEVEELQSNMPAFGMLPPMPIVLPPPTRLEPGDVYVVLSDGFYEANDPEGEEMGTEQLAETLRAHHGATAEEILSALREALEEHTRGAPPDDDRTAVIVKRT